MGRGVSLQVQPRIELTDILIVAECVPSPGCFGGVAPQAKDLHSWRSRRISFTTRATVHSTH